MRKPSHWIGASMVFIVFAAGKGYAQNVDWTGATATWADGSNWNTFSPPGTSNNARFTTVGNTTPTLAASSTTTIKSMQFNGSTNYTITGGGASSTLLILDANSNSGVNLIDTRFFGTTQQTYSNLTLRLADSLGTTGQNKVLMSNGESVTVASNATLEVGTTFYVESADSGGSANFNINGGLVVTAPSTIHVDNPGVALNLNFTSASGLNDLNTSVAQGSSGGVINFLASGDYGTGISRYFNDGGSLATAGTYNVAASGITIMNRTLSFNQTAPGGNDGKFGTLGATYASGTSTYAGSILLADPFNLAGAKTNVIHVANSAATLELSGTVSAGDSSFLTVNKTGAGELLLSNASGNTFLANSFNVTAGTLRVTNTSGSATGTSLVTVSAGAILGGTGRITGATTISGIVAPGNSIGTLTIANDVTWNGGAVAGSATDWQFELGSGNTADLLSITGGSSDFLKGTGSVYRFDFMGSLDTGTFVLVDWGGTTNFNIGDFSYTNLGASNTGTFQFNGSQLEFVAVIPEPRTWALLAAGALGALVLRRRSR